MPPSDPPRFETPPERRKLDLRPLLELLMSLHPNVGDFEMVLKLGLGQDLADIAPETLPRRQRYLKALEAFEAQGSLLDLRQALLEQSELRRRREDIDSAFDRVLGPAPPEDFNDFRAMERWFGSHDPEVAVVFAARAALRVAPLLGSDQREEAPTALILPSLRATAAPWLAGTWPSLGADFSDYAALAAYAAADAAANAAADAAADAALAARIAADAAADAAANAALVAAYAANAANAARAAAYAANAAYAALVAAYAANADAAAIREGYGAAALARRTLWPDGAMPPTLADAWHALKTRLLAREGEHWEVWTEWYEARLRGDPGNPALEYERVTSPEIDWKAGPATVNAKIKEIIERRKASTQSSVSDESLEQASPQGIDVAIGESSLLLGFVPRPPTPAEAYQSLIGKVEDRLTPCRGLGNQYDDLDDILNDLQRAVGALVDQPWRVHEEFRLAIKDIDALPDEAMKERRLRNLRLVLDDGIIDLQDMIPELNEKVAGRARARITMPPDDVLDEIERLLGVLDPITERDLIEELRERLTRLREARAAGVEEGAPLEDERLKDDAYTESGLLVRAKRRVVEGAERAGNVADQSAEVAAKVAKLEKAAETGVRVWEKIAPWMQTFF